ncbi:hypothetical protein phiOC_p292 [Ochrobactrum phage vB_OspM_OC]|nr:hypothetical protein phiOC_p292 [Ochrobactrum phage vB_OspM_OC]
MKFSELFSSKKEQLYLHVYIVGGGYVSVPVANEEIDAMMFKIKMGGINTKIKGVATHYPYHRIERVEVGKKK